MLTVPFWLLADRDSFVIVGSYDRKLNKTSDPPEEYRATDANAASAGKGKGKAAATAETTGKGKSGASPPAPT